MPKKLLRVGLACQRISEVRYLERREERTE